MAMNLASRANASAGLGGVPMLIGDGSVMPAGQVERKDVMGMGFVGGAHPSAMARGIGSFEPGVQTSIPNSPLMGQITLIAPPMEVASAEAERAGTAVSFDVKTLAKGAGALDATSLTMLKSAMPQGLQAIYPALPQSQLGPHAVNMKLAPSLLGQILNEGYGGRAAQMTPHFADAASKVSLSSPVAMPMEASIVPVTSRPVGDQAGLLGAAGGTEKGLGQIGAGGASRGGALDFLGMPVRLAPSLAGSPEMSAAAEARKAMPPGAAAVMRPNEFAPLRSKLFPAFGSVKAEPDQKAWEKAAPSYGMRSARPENLLSPEARLKPPAGGASVPQMHTVSPTATAKALAGAAAVSSIADAAMPSGLHALSSSAMAGGALGAFAGGGLAAMGQAGPLGMISGLRGSRGGVPAVPSLGSVMSLARPNSLMAAGFAGRFAGGMAAPAMSFGSPTQPGMSPSVMSQRVASRWSPAAPMGKGLGLPSLSSTVPATPHSPGIPSVKTHTKSSNGPASPQMPRMRPGIPATPSMTQSLSSSAPAMTDSPIPTTAGAHPGISNLAAPAPATLPKIGGESASVRERPKSSILAHQAPAMPIAASVAAAKPTASSTFVQRAQMNEGIATAPNSSIQEPEHSSSRTTKDPGQSAHEINMLANEVWTLLRRKLTFEAERMGRR
jgi:hypothetical protein